MDIERRALYNLLHMNWLRNPSMKAEPWQIENYRELPTKLIFERLQAHGFQLDKVYFLSLAGEVETPEELTSLLLEDVEPTPSPTTYDQVYLLIFELWRRFVTDRPCLSIFCDELDYQIHLHDTGKLENDEAMQDIISNLQAILDENADKGMDPHSVFSLISSNCAHDLESFLYDYICEQLDNYNDIYANELLDGFMPYIEDVKWFDFLRMRLQMHAPKADSARHINQIIDRYAEDNDLEFNLEVLTFMIKAGNRELFAKLARKTIPLISIEADFQDLLDICAEFYHYLDLETQERGIRKLLSSRAKNHYENKFDPNDPDVPILLANL